MELSKFKLIKTNKKSEVYENEQYIIKVKDAGFAYPPRWFRDELESCGGEDSDRLLQPIDVVEVTNKLTKRTTSKRMFQGNPRYELEDDLLNNDKKKFYSTIWSKID